MTDVSARTPDGLEDDATTQLLRLAGPRGPVSAARAERVRAAVHAEWRARTRQRAIRRIAFASVALAVGAAFVPLLGRIPGVARRAPAPGDVVAIVERIEGVPHRSNEAPSEATTRLTPADAVRAGEWIQTDGVARVALRFPDGTSVRLDAGSRARLLSSTAIELSAGAVYVDTGRESGRFEVRTAIATAHDVGTQFEIRLLDRTVRLRVRSGAVDLNAGKRSVSARQGTEILLSEREAVSRPIPLYGAEWAWTTRVSPPLDIEGLHLSSFLERIAREHGWGLGYADASLARDASEIVLHGSVQGLSPEDAVQVAITTSGLAHRLDNGTLVVLRGADGKGGPRP